MGGKEDNLNTGEPGDCLRLITVVTYPEAYISNLGCRWVGLILKRVVISINYGSPPCRRFLPAFSPLPFRDAVLDPSVASCNRLFMHLLLFSSLLCKPLVKVESWDGD